MERRPHAEAKEAQDPPPEDLQGVSRANGNGGLPLSTQLSQVLVAFTIECDNEFERQMPHRTTTHGATPDAPGAPWLVSLVMYANCLQFLGDEGLSVRELEGLARTTTNVDGMRR